MSGEGVQYRPNKVSDVAKVWLQVMQPWSLSPDFITAAIALGNCDEMNDDRLFNNKS